MQSIISIRKYAYEYIFLSMTDIMEANVDNMSEGLLKDIEEENRVLHFVYKFKQTQREKEGTQADASKDQSGAPRKHDIPAPRSRTAHTAASSETEPDMETSSSSQEGGAPAAANNDKPASAGESRDKRPWSQRSVSVLGRVQWSDGYMQRIHSTIEAILDIKHASAAKACVIYNVPAVPKENDVRDLWLEHMKEAEVYDELIFGDLTLDRLRGCMHEMIQ